MGMEILEQLNASLRQSFQKLVGAVRMEHRSRLVGPICYLCWSSCVQMSVMHDTAAVAILSYWDALLHCESL